MLRAVHLIHFIHENKIFVVSDIGLCAIFDRLRAKLFRRLTRSCVDNFVVYPAIRSGEERSVIMAGDNFSVPVAVQKNKIRFLFIKRSDKAHSVRFFAMKVNHGNVFLLGFADDLLAPF